MGRRKSQPARKRPPHYRLCLETLETRLAPASFIWTGNAGAGNTNWSAGANWFGGVAPTGANDDLIFPTLGGAGPFTTNNNLNNALVKSIRFQGNNYTVTGNALTLGTSAGGVALISESGAFGNTINLGVTLAAGNGSSEVFQIAAGTTVLFGGSSSISGVAGATLDKRDLGVLALNGNNSSLNSLINVGQGILGVANPNALGATSAGTTVQPNAQLQISNNVTVNEPLLLNGPGIINDGALLNASGANTWAGTITLDSDAILGSATGGSLNISGLIQDNGAGHNITKEGGGQLIFSHVGGNTYRGLTTINNGILTIQDPLSLGAQGLGAPRATAITPSPASPAPGPRPPSPRRASSPTFPPARSSPSAASPATGTTVPSRSPASAVPPSPSPSPTRSPATPSSTSTPRSSWGRRAAPSSTTRRPRTRPARSRFRTSIPRAPASPSSTSWSRSTGPAPAAPSPMSAAASPPTPPSRPPSNPGRR
ncbi:MAG: hypothetical protein U0793_13005 [Gemmataceae bacterium]